jgi:hypothetical protein
MIRTIAVAVALVLAAGIGAVLAYAATRPDSFRVQRTTRIEAPPQAIFPLVNDLHSFARWSPYEKKDPAMKRTYSGAASGKGAVYEWDGDRNVGQGRIEIIDASPPSKVTLALDMIRPFAAHNTVEFTLEPRGEASSGAATPGTATDVSWSMHGAVPYLAKVVHVFIDVDRMVGRDFEAGLAELKALAEGRKP